MHILISNDDGYMSPGINALAAALREVGDVTIVAPDQERSTSSNSLTIRHPLRVTRMGERIYAVDGTPTDCVHLAVTGLLKDPAPNIVVSGINFGENLGDDVLYSGTVAAAMEGRFQGLPSIAVSSVSHNPKHLDTAAAIARDLVLRLLDEPLPNRMILNINVPDLPPEEIGPCECTRLGNRHLAEPVIKAEDPRGEPVYWVGAPGDEADAGEGTDFYAVSQNRVSVTPLHIDLTHYKLMERVGDWTRRFDDARRS